MVYTLTVCYIVITKWRLSIGFHLSNVLSYIVIHHMFPSPCGASKQECRILHAGCKSLPHTWCMVAGLGSRSLFLWFLFCSSSPMSASIAPDGVWGYPPLHLDPFPFLRLSSLFLSSALMRADPKCSTTSVRLESQTHQGRVTSF